ncbi:hypothetical protein M413DRAFT_31467 [Hebeloma cylindrosporum]|uniref:Uncharacterized protein n=1 Tax=Hebeloma cylindrosporum TaxID=76867 RepID=A0A0C3BX59_HEBCY|nr:hypothetical protein M413DRAFT_31467 [Hebeloma cylindrosporum h7]
MPTPPSPSPTLTQSGSNSASNSSSSPPEPMTPLPLEGRSRPRYPGLGRVPLHRRGTSRTYECMEDLLKEAGYKETRIFTPETDRKDVKGDGGSDDSRLSVVKDGMEAVVGFLAGLMPSASSSKSSPRDYDPPVSPLTQRYSGPRRSLDLTEPPTPTTLTSSIDSLREPTPRASRQQTNSPAPTVIYHRPALVRTPSQLSYASRQVRKQPSRNSINHVPPPNLTIASPRPSRAGAYLRHMASVPDIPPRPNSTPAHRPRILLNDSDSEGPPSIYTRSGNGEGESEEPPLPPTWLETVARAVLFGGTGAYVGGPSHFQQDVVRLAPPPFMSTTSKQGKEQVLRATRSSLSQVSSSRRSKYHQRMPLTARSGLSDQTNFLVPPPPPPLFSRIERGRAGTSESEVSKTRVVCRSAPGSRSGSVDGQERRGRGNKRKQSNQDRLPSLARTKAEGDVWSRTTKRHNARSAAAGGASSANRYLGGWGAESDSEEEGKGHEGVTSEDDDEGELDLARILVPPKRQNSIKSLRKHLAPTDGAGSSAQAKLKNIAGAIIPGAGGQPAALQRKNTNHDWDGENNHQEEWGAGWVRKAKGSRASEDEDVESFHGFFGEGRTELVGSGRSGTGKRRLGFNGAWGLGAAS